jgi:hypothetical protein
MNPDPQQSGLFGFFQRMRRPDDQTGLSPFQRFGAALDPLIMPEMRAGQQIREQGAQRLAQANRNKTKEFLASQPNGAIYAQALDMGVPIGEVYRAFLAEQKGDYVVVGNSLVDRNTGKVIYNAKGGGMGGFTYTAPDGSTIQIGMPDLNQDKSNAMGFGTRVVNANAILSAVDTSGTDLFQNFLNSVPFGLGRYYQDDSFRSYDDARRDFVNAVLRRESGAAIAESEFESANRQYFPVPGDSQEQILQKRMRRELAGRLLLGSAGPEGARFGIATLEDLQKSLNPLFGTKAYNKEREKLQDNENDDIEEL